MRYENCADVTINDGQITLGKTKVNDGQITLGKTKVNDGQNALGKTKANDGQSNLGKNKVNDKAQIPVSKNRPLKAPSTNHVCSKASKSQHKKNGTLVHRKKCMH